MVLYSDNYQRSRLVYSREILRNTRLLTGMSLCIFGFAYYFMTHDLKSYDYIVYGSGNLTKSLIHFLTEKPGLSVVQIVPYSDSVSCQPIDGTDLCITSSKDLVFNESFFHYPRCTKEELSELRKLTGLTEGQVLEAENKLIGQSGQRGMNSYYYNFESKTVDVKQLKKQHIEFIKSERRGSSETGGIKVYFNDLSFIRGKCLLFCDTGNTDEILRYFWNRECTLYPSILIGMSNKVVKNNQVNFLPVGTVGRTVDIMTFIDRTFFYKGATLAKGTPDNFRCIYDNSAIETIDAVAKGYLGLGDIRYHLESRIFGLMGLTKNFKAWNNKRVLLLNPLVLPAGLHWKRNILMLFMLVEQLTAE